MSHLDIQDKIVARLEQVPGIANGAGKVRVGYQRAIIPEDFEELFQVQLEETKPINAWIVVWDSAAASRPDSLSSLVIDHRFSIIGFRSYNKTSDAEIRVLAERIMQSFMTYLTLGLYGDKVEETIVEDSTIEITGFGHDALGPVLCSRAELLITARERRVPVEWED